MIVKKEFINKLKEFGLNSYEGKLWVALLSRGISTAGELSDISNVPRSRAYDVLESLEKKGFIVVKLGKPIKYIAVPPREVLERVKKKVKEEAESRSNALDKLKESPVLGELQSLHSTGVEMVDPVDKSGAFRGRPKVYEHMASMVKSAKRSVTIATTADGLARKLNSLKNDLRKAKERGVTIRLSAPITAQNRKVAKDLSQYGEVRSATLDQRFCSVDGEQLMVMLMDGKNVHETYDSGIWMHTPFFVEKFDQMFERAWNEQKKV